MKQSFQDLKYADNKEILRTYDMSDMDTTPLNQSEDQGEEIINLVLVENMEKDQMKKHDKKSKRGVSPKKKMSIHERLYLDKDREGCVRSVERDPNLE